MKGGYIAMPNDAKLIFFSVSMKKDSGLRALSISRKTDIDGKAPLQRELHSWTL